MNGSMLPSSAISLRLREANSPSAHSLTPGRCDAKTPGENTCALVAFSITISTVLVPVPSAGSLYCAWAIDEIVRNAIAAGVNLTKRIILPLRPVMKRSEERRVGNECRDRWVEG